MRGVAAPGPVAFTTCGRSLTLASACAARPARDRPVTVATDHTRRDGASQVGQGAADGAVPLRVRRSNGPHLSHE